MYRKMVLGAVVLLAASLLPVSQQFVARIVPQSVQILVGATAVCADDCIPIFFPCDECEESPYEACSHSQALIPVEGWRLRD